MEWQGLCARQMNVFFFFLSKCVYFGIEKEQVAKEKMNQKKKNVSSYLLSSSQNCSSGT